MPKIAKAVRINPIIINLPSFPFHLRSDTLRESNGILLTINSDRITVNITSKTGEPENEVTAADSE